MNQQSGSILLSAFSLSCGTCWSVRHQRNTIFLTCLLIPIVDLAALLLDNLCPGISWACQLASRGRGRSWFYGICPGTALVLPGRLGSNPLPHRCQCSCACAEMLLIRILTGHCMTWEPMHNYWVRASSWWCTIGITYEQYSPLRIRA